MTTTTQPHIELPVLPQKRITLEEFVAMGEGPPYYEFEDGLLIPRNGDDPMGSPKTRHQRLMALLYVFIYQFLIQHRMGDVVMEVDVYLPDGKMYIPDITFIAANGGARLDPDDDKIHGAPELVVEILSSDQRRDRVVKRRAYQRNGILWYWIIDAHVLTLEELEFMADGSTRTRTVDKNEDFQPALFPGLTINLAALMGEQTESVVADANVSDAIEENLS